MRFIMILALVFGSCGKIKEEDKKKDPEETAGEDEDVKQGATGATGAAGATGASGSTGATGARGEGADYVPTDFSARSPSSVSMGVASTYCRDLVENSYSDWHIPTLQEMDPFFGTDADTNWLWTRSLSTSTSMYFTIARVSDGLLSTGSGTAYARCVR